MDVVKNAITLANANIKLANLEKRARELKEVEDPYLYSALYSCIEAVEKLPEELAKIDEEIERVYNSAPEDPKTPIRIKYMEWSKQNLTWNVERASKTAQARLKHLEALNSPAKRKAEIEKCRLDTKYWFKWYAWTVDPRSNLLWAVPFILFEYQEEYIDWVEALMFKRRTDGLIDKSRDMGITWTTIDLFGKHWLMPMGGTSFQALVGSIKATDVDELGNPSTTLEKLRLQFRLTPKWMLPNGFDPKFPLMKCINPENGSSITGETANEDFGRSGRYTVIWFDEYARFELAEPAYTASSQSTNTRLFTFTPYGKTNYASYLRFNGNMPIKSYHWRRHPFKTEDWYNGEALKLTKSQIGQELDINYETSQEGRVYETYSELYHTITKSEFFSAFPESRGRDNQFLVPRNCFVGMGNDWGCVLPEAEALTKDGWKNRSQLKEGELIAGYDYENSKKLIWTPIRKFIDKKDQKVVQMKSKSFDFICTENHRWITRSKRNGSEQGEELNRISKYKNIVVSAQMDEVAENKLSDEYARVLSWVVTDGWVEVSRHQKPSGAIICQKNYPEKVIEDLNNSGLQWTERKTTKNGTRIFAIPKTEFDKIRSQSGYTDKDSLIKIATSISSSARRNMLEVMKLAEGTGKEGKIFTQNSGAVMESFQIMSSLEGIRLNVEKPHQSGYGTKAKRIRQIEHTVVQKPVITDAGRSDVWCVSVDTKAFLCRSNGQITVTGNSSQDHANMMLWFFVGREGFVTTKGIDLSGCVFLFNEHRQAPSSTVRMCANYIKEFESSVRLDQNFLSDRLMSHEAKSERDTYAIDHSLDFRAWSTDLNSGIAQVKDYLEIHSFHQPHPFREYTREEYFSDKAPIMGRPRFFIIVDDEQGGLNFDEEMGRWYVNVPVDDAGAFMTRTEFPMYHYPKPEMGKPTKRLKPVKMKDDAMDVLRCVASTFFPPIAPLTQSEKMEKAMPEGLKTHNILKETPEEMSRSYIARIEIKNKLLKNQKLATMNWRERIYEKQRK